MSKYLNVAIVPNLCQLSSVLVAMLSRQPTTGSLHNTAATLALCKLNCNTEVTRTCIRSAHYPPPPLPSPRDIQQISGLWYSTQISPIMIQVLQIILNLKSTHCHGLFRNDLLANTRVMSIVGEEWRRLTVFVLFRLAWFTFLSIMTSQFFAWKISYKGSINWLFFFCKNQIID